MRTLQSRIKMTRLNLGLSQAGLAKQTGVSQPTVANWENGSHIPRQKALENIGSALGVESDWLLSGEYAKAHNSVQEYLSRPIRHIPIYKWPDTPGALFMGAPEGYLTYPSETQHTRALIDPKASFGGKHIWIVEDMGEVETDSGIILWDNGLEISLAPCHEKPTGAKPVGQLKAEIKTY